MTDPNSFIDIGEDFLEHSGKLGMRWGHRNASDYNSESSYDYDRDQRDEDNYAGPPEVSRKGKIAGGVVIGIVGTVLVAAMVPGVREAGITFVKNPKNNDLFTTKMDKIKKVSADPASLFPRSPTIANVLTNLRNAGKYKKDPSLLFSKLE